MRAQRFRAAAILVAAALSVLLAAPVMALITKPILMRELVEGQPFIFIAKVEKVDTDKPAIILNLSEDLKGKIPCRRMPVNMTGDKEAAKDNHQAILFKRLAVDQPVVVFAKDINAKTYLAFGYTNGTWFQLFGKVRDDDTSKINWSLTHAEPYLRRTFKGSTDEMKQVIVDALAKKKAPPEPDDKVEPGFGPELAPATKEEKEKREECRRPATGRRGPPLAVIPTVFVMGPLALLATLFPAVFGGLQRRWLVVLTILSIDSTLYVLYFLGRGYVKDYAWGTPTVLWTVMALVALLGIAWSARRYEAAAASGQAAAMLVKRFEIGVLVICSLAAAGTVAWAAAQHVLGDSPWRELLVVAVVLWVGTLYQIVLGFMRRTTVERRPRPATEAVMLATMGLACLGAAVAQPRGDASAATSAGGAEVRLAWQFEAKDRGSVDSTALVVGDRVYVGAAHQEAGRLYCLNRLTGKEEWTFDDQDNETKSMRPLFSSPCLAGGRLYFGEGFHEHKYCRLFCLDAETRKKVWECETESHTESSPCVVGGKVWIGAGDDGMFCVNAETGKPIWHFKEDGIHIDTNPVVANGLVFGASGYGKFEAFALEADTGKPVWRVPFDLPVFGSPVVDGGQVFFGFGNGDLLKSADKPAGGMACFDAKTGRRIWQTPMPDGVHDRPVVDANHVWFGCRDGAFCCVNRADGKEKWRVSLGSPIVAAPTRTIGADGADALYVIASRGKVVSLNPADGSERWTFDVAASTGLKPMMVSSPVVVASEGGKRQIFFGAGLDNLVTTAAVMFCLEETSK